MLQAILFNLVAILAVLSLSVVDINAVDERALQPQQDYRHALRRVRQARTKAYGALLYYKPPVTSPSLHYFLLLRTVDAAANNLLANNESALAAYRRAVSYDLPKALLNPVNASLKLEKDLKLVDAALKPLADYLDNNCKNLDDKDCNLLFELSLQNKKDPQTLLRLKAANVLNKTQLLSRKYLKLHERFLAAANRLSGLGYAFNKKSKLSNLAQQAADALAAAKAKA